jgi:hypothetical protein
MKENSMPVRKRRFVIGLAAWTALAVCVLVGSRAVSAAGADIYGVGGGSIRVGGLVKFAKFAFSGHSGPDGDFGSIRFTVEDPTSPLDVHVDVDCVNVFPMLLGGGGWMGGAVKRVTPESNLFGIAPGDQMMIGFNDFGEPSDPVPDEWDWYFGAPQFCKVIPPLRATHMPVSQGNIVVKFD